MSAQRRVRWTSSAKRSAHDAFHWYMEQSPRAAEKFLAELDAAMAAVLEAPERWPMWLAPYRRKLFKRYPYSLLYRSSGAGGVLVVAVRHQQRDPNADIRE